jgi:enamine deaminase RidA (YjgF/YER057c/UK114 family)
MAALSYSNPKGKGAELSEHFHYSQAVRLPTNPPTIKISGQGGWEPASGDIIPPTSAENITKQVEQTFANVDDVLRTAGSKNGWADVYLARAFVVGMQDFDGVILGATADALKKWCPNHSPVLTAIEVKGLALDGMTIEVEVEALVNE